MGQQVVSHLESIQREMAQRANEARRLERFVLSARFLHAYSLRSPGEYIPLDRVEEWADAKIDTDLDALTLAKLREKARSLGIVKYTMWSKASLLIKVKNVLKSKETRSVGIAEAPKQLQDREDGHCVGVGGLGQRPVLPRPSEGGNSTGTPLAPSV